MDEDDLEIVNDDGFVYKRKKRRLDPTTSSAPPPPQLDAAIEEKSRRKRKKKAILKLKDKYQKEISQWEHLSNTLRDMELKSQTFNQTRQQHAPPSSSDDSDSVLAPKAISGRILDELLVQVEAQGEIIHDVSNMCDLAEGLCKAEEERWKQSFFELPIFDYSPQELMASLCEE